MTKSIAVLLTVFNRKEKTLACLEALNRQDGQGALFTTKTFVVDGGSTDGTEAAVRAAYPEVEICRREGLFWAGGMRSAWELALDCGTDFDFFLLVNDDTALFTDTIRKLTEAQAYALSQYGKEGICIGSTRAIGTNRFSYGGRKLRRWGHSEASVLIPDDNCHLCELGNANIMLVSKAVCHCIGILSHRYTHGIADYDYTLRAVREGFPVLVVPGYCGECDDDHGNNWAPASASLKQRIRYLKSPKGLAYKEYLYYIKEFFPKEYASAWVKLWLKTLFPQLWDKFKKRN